MFINPQEAIDKGWIIGIKDPAKQVQPNAIDFTLDKLFTINNANTFILCTDKETGKEIKQMRNGTELQPIPDRRTGTEFFHVYGLTCVGISSYDAMSDVYVKLPEGVAAFTVIRSTLNRNGLFLTSGLYDSGYEGHIGFAIHNMSGEAKIEKGSRVGQIVFVKSENSGLYAGGWNHEQGTHYVEGHKIPLASKLA